MSRASRLIAKIYEKMDDNDMEQDDEQEPKMPVKDFIKTKKKDQDDPEHLDGDDEQEDVDLKVDYATGSTVGKTQDGKLKRYAFATKKDTDADDDGVNDDEDTDD